MQLSPFDKAPRATVRMRSASPFLKTSNPSQKKRSSSRPLVKTRATKSSVDNYYEQHVRSSSSPRPTRWSSPRISECTLAMDHLTESTCSDVEDHEVLTTSSSSPFHKSRCLGGQKCALRSPHKNHVQAKSSKVFPKMANDPAQWSPHRGHMQKCADKRGIIAK